MFLWMRDRGTHQRQALVSYKCQIWSTVFLEKESGIFLYPKGSTTTLWWEREKFCIMARGSATELNIGSFTFLFNFSTESNMHHQECRQWYRYTTCARCKLESPFFKILLRKETRKKTAREKERNVSQSELTWQNIFAASVIYNSLKRTWFLYVTFFFGLYLPSKIHYLYHNFTLLYINRA